jgi:RNA polymerase sigma-70 factor (ECF subfamily)
MGVPVREAVSQKVIADALSGHEPALATLIDRLTPTIQERVAWVLVMRQPWGERRDIRQEVEDLTQEVLMALFATDGKVLRDWNPERGLSLERFVALVTERRVTSVLRSKRRNPWRDRPTAPEDLDRGRAGASSPHARAQSKQLYQRLLDRMREVLSPLAWHLFELLFIEERSIGEVRDTTALSAAAVYAWRSRLRKTARKLAGELGSPPRADVNKPLAPRPEDAHG